MLFVSLLCLSDQQTERQDKLFPRGYAAKWAVGGPMHEAGELPDLSQTQRRMRGEAAHRTPIMEAWYHLGLATILKGGRQLSGGMTLRATIQARRQAPSSHRAEARPKYGAINQGDQGINNFAWASNSIVEEVPRSAEAARCESSVFRFELGAVE